MVELSPVVVGVVVVAAVVGAVPVAASTAGGQATPTEGAATASNESLAPGEQLAAVVSVQQADIEAEVGARAFGQRIAAAASNTSKAGVVKGEVDALQERLSALREERRELRAAHRNGSLSDGQYRAKLTALHAKTRAVERRLNGSAQAASGLPAQALEAKGINASAIQQLRAQAHNMTGQEVAAIARQIAGRNVGKGLPGERGPPAFVANGTNGPGNGQGPSGDDRGQAGSGDGDRGPPENRTGGPPGNETGDGDRGQGDGDERGSGDDAGDDETNGQATGLDSARVGVV
jgi:hypothetical protein